MLVNLQSVTKYFAKSIENQANLDKIRKLSCLVWHDFWSLLPKINFVWRLGTCLCLFVCFLGSFFCLFFFFFFFLQPNDLRCKWKSEIFLHSFNKSHSLVLHLKSFACQKKFKHEIHLFFNQFQPRYSHKKFTWKNPLWLASQIWKVNISPPCW